MLDLEERFRGIEIKEFTVEEFERIIANKIKILNDFRTHVPGTRKLSQEEWDIIRKDVNNLSVYLHYASTFNTSIIQKYANELTKHYNEYGVMFRDHDDRPVYLDMVQSTKVRFVKHKRNKDKTLGDITCLQKCSEEHPYVDEFIRRVINYRLTNGSEKVNPEKMDELYREYLEEIKNKDKNEIVRKRIK